MKKNRTGSMHWLGMLSVLCLLFTMVFAQNDTVSAASTGKYGILIANSSGKYTWYDLTGAKGTQRIEIKSTGTVMVPVKKVTSYMSTISYSFSYDTMSATLTNKKNGKKVVVKKGSIYATTYASKKAKGKKVKLSAKTYLSPDSNACMADQKVMKYLFANTTGYRFYAKSNKTSAAKITAAGYNGSALKGIIIYNPFKAVSAVPSATKVGYVSEKDLSNIIKVTVPEGYSAAQIGNLMVSKGVCQSTKAFLTACNSVNASSYWFLDGVSKSSKRCFYIEGYLYPSTYEFYKNTSPASVVAKMLSNAGTQFTKADVAQAKKLGYSFDQVLTIASVIEKEVSKTSEIKKVSSVLENRLSSKMKLQCDATINYVERYIKPYISGDMNRYNSYYNTYKCSALPSGPICNPGRASINAALYPEQTDYLYFCSDTSGNYYYAATYDEHLKNVELCK